MFACTLNSQLRQDDFDKALSVVKEISDFIKNNQEFNIITIFDKNYPSNFLKLSNKDRPVILYTKGDISLLNKSSVAIIGTRNPIDWSVKTCRKIVKHIVKNTDNVIISGLGVGIDAIAHQETINNHGPTIAILPCGLSSISPISNRNLANDIYKNGGCLISAYIPSFKATKYTFIHRDVLVGCLTDKVLVIQCSEDSGTIKTTEFAAQFGKKIGCIYTDYVIKNQKLFAGNEYLVNNKKYMIINNTEQLSAFL
jgi:DNA processing protein